MKKFVLLLCFVFVPHAFGLEGISYSLSYPGGICSATLIKVEGQCHLVTNAHCVRSQDQVFTLGTALNYIDYREEFIEIEKTGYTDTSFDSRESHQRNTRWFHERVFFDNRSPETEVKVISFDKTKDLALLEVPEFISQGENKICDQILETSSEPQKAEEIDEVRYVGFARENLNSSVVPHVTYPRNSSMLGKHLSLAKVETKRRTSYLENGKSVLVIDNSEFLPGNSGGMAIDKFGGFVGITAAIIPTQDRVYVIPREEVVEYVKNPTQDNKIPQSKINLSDIGGCILINEEHLNVSGGSILEVGGSSGGNTGGSSGGNTGGGAPCPTGGSSGGNTGGSSGGNTSAKLEGDTPCVARRSLDIFAEVDEGFIDDMERIVIAIGDAQIDGLADYKDHKGEGEVIALEADGYPSLEIRKGIVDRLKGFYPRMSSTHKRYKEDHNHVLGFDERMQGFTNAEVTVTDSTIDIITDFHPIRTSETLISGARNPSNRLAKIRKKFNIEVSDDYKQVFLSDGFETLTCENRNYLKLNCANENTQFSFSVTDTAGSQPTMRYTKRNGDRVQYLFTPLE